MHRGGKTCLYTHFVGAKALFTYINLQVPDSVEGKPMQNFPFGAMLPVPPAGTCLYGGGEEHHASLIDSLGTMEKEYHPLYNYGASTFSFAFHTCIGR